MSCSAPQDLNCTGTTCGDCTYWYWRTSKKNAAFTLDELLALHDSTCANARKVMAMKNHDYTCGSVGVFDNFKAASLVGVHPVAGILVRSLDKFKRVQTFLTLDKLAVEGEGVLDALDDVINYMILAKGMLIEEQRNKP